MRQSSLAVQQTTTYFAVDLAKFVAAFLVMSIHVPAAQDADKFFLIWVRGGIARLAVPFFFCAAGFFLAQKGLDDAKRVMRYVGRIGVLYLVWSAVYLPVIVQTWRGSSAPIQKHIFTLVRNSFVTGTYLHLWYFPALMIGVLLLWAVRRLPQWGKLALAVVLYWIGILGNAYEAPVRSLLRFLEPVTAVYVRFFLTTRNGLLFAFPLICMGAWIASIQQRSSMWTDGVGLLLSLVLLAGEVAWLQHIAPGTDRDTMFSLAPVVYYLFVLLLRGGRRPAPVCIRLRDCSVLIYLLHPLLFVLVQRWLPPVSAAWQYGMVAVSSLVGAALFLRLQRVPCLRWLRWMF